MNISAKNPDDKPKEFNEIGMILETISEVTNDFFLKDIKPISNFIKKITKRANEILTLETINKQRSDCHIRIGKAIEGTIDDTMTPIREWTRKDVSPVGDFVKDLIKKSKKKITL